MMDYEKIIYDKDPPIGRIILNQPEKRNPLGYQRLFEVADALKEMERDGEIKIIIIKGAGPCFSAGYDLTPIPPGQPMLNQPANGVYTYRGRDGTWGSYNKEHLRVYYTIWDLQLPVIAQVHSYCLAGAFELSGFCDIRFVSEDAVIGFPVARALSPGNIQYTPWMIGMTKAREMYYTGDTMDGEEAHRVGWATRVYPSEQLEEETEKFAQRMAMIETDLIMMSKRNINRQMEIMGFRTATEQIAIDFLTAGGTRESSSGGGEFARIRNEQGLKAALDWRDAKFGDLRTSEEARQKRGES